VVYCGTVAAASGVATGVAAPKMCVTELPFLFAIHTPPVGSMETELGAFKPAEVP
jgi:hypothetical protein